MTSLEDALSWARDVAIEAGEILRRHFGSTFDVQMKGWADPVTIADRESEAFIRAELHRRFPDDGLDGEEEAPWQGTSGRIWLIDPLDGTADFSGGLPIFAVVLTLVEAEWPDRARLNVTYDPVRRELFQARAGGGAYCNNVPLRVRANTDVSGALVNLHFSNQRQVWESSMDLARRITSEAPHARSLGSTAIGQAYVAAGRLDAHVKVQTGKYDVVGGNLLIEEAGGVIGTLNGETWRYPGSLLAASAAMYPLLLARTRGLVQAGA